LHGCCPESERRPKNRPQHNLVCLLLRFVFYPQGLIPTERDLSASQRVKLCAGDVLRFVFYTPFRRNATSACSFCMTAPSRRLLRCFVFYPQG
jgi:hypothetical protein